jgi:hypothetical protein
MGVSLYAVARSAGILDFGLHEPGAYAPGFMLTSAPRTSSVCGLPDWKRLSPIT